MQERVQWFEREGKLIEAQRIRQRTMFDIEMMKELGYCSGIENYSRHLTGRAKGEPPPTLVDYFPDDYLLFIDEIAPYFVNSSLDDSELQLHRFITKLVCTLNTASSKIRNRLLRPASVVVSKLPASEEGGEA